MRTDVYRPTTTHDIEYNTILCIYNILVYAVRAPIRTPRSPPEYYIGI